MDTKFVINERGQTTKELMELEPIDEYQVFQHGGGLAIRIPAQFAEHRGIVKGVKARWNAVVGDKAKAVLEFTSNGEPVRVGESKNGESEGGSESD